MTPKEIMDFIDLGRRHEWTPERILTSLYSQAEALRPKGHRHRP